LAEAYPGVRFYSAGMTRIVYGKPMTAAGTPEQAARQWLAEHGRSLGVERLDLRPTFSSVLRQGRFTAFGYQQYLDGFPVEGAIARVLVLNGRDVNEVVYASGHLASLPDGYRPIVAIEPDAAMLVATRLGAYRDLPQWSGPELVMYVDDQAEAPTPVLTWKFSGSAVDAGQARKFTFFVDAATGAMVHVRDDIITIDATGNVVGMGSPGTLPDIGSNPPVALPMIDMRASVSGGSSAFTDRDGMFVIPTGGGAPVLVSVAVRNGGRWADVRNASGSTITASATITPGTPGTITLNPTPGGTNSRTTAQVNGYVQTTSTHNFFKDRAPGFTGLDIAMPVSVNRSDLLCNAFFDGASINFMVAGGGCNNTAYSSVIAHEYGHFIVQSLGLAQGAFGEGFGDTIAVLEYDDCIVGRNFFSGGGIIRNLCNNRSFPCAGEIHDCGEVLAGTWWDIRENLGATFGSATGLAMSQDLEVAWSLITMGGQGTDAAVPRTAIEVLTVDDDNGDLQDGTPNYTDICDAFSQHGIDCPPLPEVTFDYPDGRPQFVSPNAPTTFRVDAIAGIGEPVEGTGFLQFSIDGGSTQGSFMTVLGPNMYEATLPIVDCGSTIAWSVSVGVVGGGSVTDPDIGSFSAPSATSIEVAVDDPFETASGWTVGAPGDDATTGIWNRMNPQGTAAQPEDDHTVAGTICWVTDGFAGSGLGDRDVDNGKTTLVSPSFDLSAASDATVSYWRWYSNDTGATPGTDIFVVELSNDAGATWQTVEIVGPTGPEASGSWHFHSFLLSDIAAPSSDVRVRFVASDEGAGSLVEAAVDDFKIEAIICDATACLADIDGDGDADVADFFAFVSLFAGGDPAADLNGDGTVDVSDFFAFVSAFAVGCP